MSLPRRGPGLDGRLAPAVGGRGKGYRTRSRISHFGRNPQGDYSCTVQTRTGQVLGTRSVRIGER